MVKIQETNTAWNLFKEYLSTTIEKFAPLKERTVRGRDCPWLNQKLKKEIRERDFLLAKCKKSGSENNWSAYQRKRNAVTKMLRSNIVKYNQNLLNENADNPKRFWEQIKKCFPSKKSTISQSSSVFCENGVKIMDKKEIAERFCSFFTKIAAKLQGYLPVLTSLTWKNNNLKFLKRLINPENTVFKFKLVTPEYIVKIISKLKSSKSPGLDNIPVSIVKDTRDILSYPLCHLINLSLQNSTFPDCEKYAKIIPLFKSGSKTIFDNYRPISVLQTLSKITERVVYNQLYDYLERNKLLSQYQLGFRKQRSTTHAVTYYTNYIRNQMDKGHLTGSLYIDLCKAFDTVNHGRLLAKLQLYGIEEQELLWLESYLFGRHQSVCFENTFSTSNVVTCGVPQGSILGPLLFVLYVNDLHTELEHCRVLMYADDTVIFYSNASSKNIEEIINKEVQRVADWLRENILVINLKRGKTEFVLYGTAKRLKNAPCVKVEINGIEVTNNEVYEYLGVHVDKTLSFLEQFDKIYRKAAKR